MAMRQKAMASGPASLLKRTKIGPSPNMSAPIARITVGLNCGLLAKLNAFNPNEKAEELFCYEMHDAKRTAMAF